MKKYIIGLLLVIIIFLVSVIKKNSQKPLLNNFPIEKSKNLKTDNPELFI